MKRHIRINTPNPVEQTKPYMHKANATVKMVRKMSHTSLKGKSNAFVIECFMPVIRYQGICEPPREGIGDNACPPPQNTDCPQTVP